MLHHPQRALLSFPPGPGKTVLRSVCCGCLSRGGPFARTDGRHPPPATVRASFHPRLAATWPFRAIGTAVATATPIRDPPSTAAAAKAQRPPLVPPSGTIDDRWRAATARILDGASTPPGSMDPLRWHLAEATVLYWSGRGADGVETSFQILERLAEEAGAVVAPHDGGGGGDDDLRAGHTTVDVSLVHAALKNWNSCFRKNLTGLLPSRVLSRLDGMIGRKLESDDDTPLQNSSNGRRHRRRFFEPNVATYTIVLDGASRCPDPAERLVFAEQLLCRLVDESSGETGDPSLRPTVVTFGTVIHGLAGSKSLQAAERAEAWLRRLQALHSSGGDWSDVRPNTVIYTSVIHAWANAGRADRAEALLREMYEESVLRGDGGGGGSHADFGVAPTLRTFNTVLAAWAKSSAPHSVRSAELLLRTMVELDAGGGSGRVAPDLVSYNCLLSALARRRRDPDSLAKAEEVMERLLELGETTNPAMTPNRITYAALFRIIEGMRGSGESKDGGEKAECARRWIARSNSREVTEDPGLWQRINAMENRVKAVGDRWVTAADRSGHGAGTTHGGTDGLG